MEEGQGHWFHTATAASDMSNYCYETMGDSSWINNTNYSAYDMGFVDQGKFRRFD